MPTPNWTVERPWNHQVPTDRALQKADIKAHLPLFPGVTADDRVPLVTPQDGGHLRAALPYLIPRKGRTSRLILAWAYKAPLVLLRDLSLDFLLTDVPSHNPQAQAVVSFTHLDFIYQIEAWNDWFNFDSGRSRAHPGESLVVLSVNPKQVFVAPSDTPVHAFSSDLADFPGN